MLGSVAVDCTYQRFLLVWWVARVSPFAAVLQFLTVFPEITDDDLDWLQSGVASPHFGNSQKGRQPVSTRQAKRREGRLERTFCPTSLRTPHRGTHIQCVRAAGSNFDGTPSSSVDVPATLEVCRSSHAFPSVGPGPTVFLFCYVLCPYCPCVPA